MPPACPGEDHVARYLRPRPLLLWSRRRWRNLPLEKRGGEGEAFWCSDERNEQPGKPVAFRAIAIAMPQFLRLTSINARTRPCSGRGSGSFCAPTGLLDEGKPRSLPLWRPSLLPPRRLTPESPRQADCGRSSARYNRQERATRSVPSAPRASSTGFYRSSLRDEATKQYTLREEPCATFSRSPRASPQ
jgi:hypothetical protein